MRVRVLLRFWSAWLGREVADVITIVLAAREFLDGPVLEIRRQLARSVLCRSATQRGGARSPGFPAFAAHLFVPDDVDSLRQQTRLFANGLLRRCIQALPHFRVAVQNLHAPAL